MSWATGLQPSPSLTVGYGYLELTLESKKGGRTARSQRILCELFMGFMGD
jgi:hypothetical protein